jgi:hypothetical protein
MPRPTLPAPRTLAWLLKDLSSARTSLRIDRHDRMVMDITHDTVAGLAPKHVAWWFRNIGGEITIDGVRMSRYLAWHPRDHIQWALARPSPAGGAGPGARFRIVEAFGADPAMRIDVVEEVVRLDESGITLRNRLAGVELTRLSHDFSAAPGGTAYVSRLTVGCAVAGLAQVINPLLHRFVFTEAMGHAWLRHNVEEVGLLQHLVPLIHPDFEPARLH